MAEEEDLLPNAKKVVYCGRCGLLPEYCEFNEDFDKCKPWLKEHAPDVYPDLDTRPSAIKSKKGKKDVADKMADMKVSDAPSKKKKGKKGKDPEVLISTQSRTKRKGLTVVAGLDLFGVKLKDASKAFRKRFACSAAVVKGKDGDEVQMQGDVTYDIGDFIAKKWKKIPKKAILLVSKSGKKQPACYDSGSDDSD